MGLMICGCETTDEEEAIYGTYVNDISQAVDQIASERTISIRTILERLVWRVVRAERGERTDASIDQQYEYEKARGGAR